jgi:hypothetical protein
MGIVITRNLPILKTKEQCRKNDFLRGMCKYVNTRRTIDAAVAQQFKQQNKESK